MSLSMSGDVDPALKAAIKVLNSSTQSAEKIRIILDDLIKVRYGASKMLINTLNKKYLAEEAPAPPPIVTSSGSDDSNSMEVAYDQSASTMVVKAGSEKQQMEDNSLKDLEDLFCATCGNVTTSLRNQLVECCNCHLLYHQECHMPPIADSDAQQSEWQCSKCSRGPPESVLTSSSSASSSPTVFTMKSSSSSSPRSTGSSKSGGGGGSSSHRKSAGGGSSSKSSSGGGVGGSDKRLANIKKKLQKTK